MTFYTYMTQKYQEELSPQGELARDIKKDKERFPRNGHEGGSTKAVYVIRSGQKLSYEEVAIEENSPDNLKN